MSRKGAAVAFLGLSCLCVLSSPAEAKIYYYTLLELVEQADVVVAAEVLSVGEETARLQVREVLKGRVEVKEISVSPIWRQHCLGRSLNFRAGEEALVCLKRSDSGSLLVVGGGQGKIALDMKTRDEVLSVARRAIEIASLEGEDARNRAMLVEATSSNAKLRSESHRYIAVKIAHSKLRENYKDSLVRLLGNDSDDVQAAALAGLKFVKAEGAIPLMVEATRSESLQVVSHASMALAQYNTEQSVAALIALTGHRNPRIRLRACIDLGRSKRPEARQAIKRLTRDEDADVRRFAKQVLKNLR